MIYTDTSSLLKLLLPEEHSVAVHEFVASEAEIMISEITELEALVQLQGLRLGGTLRTAVHFKAKARIEAIINAPPFRCVSVSRTIFALALAQQNTSTTHCRSLDRLHLAAMEELGISRLMTHDVRQVEAAREMGYEVISPGQ